MDEAFPTIIEKGTNYNHKMITINNVNPSETNFNISTTMGVNTMASYNGQNSKIAVLDGSANKLGEQTAEETLKVTFPNGASNTNTAFKKVAVVNTNVKPSIKGAKFVNGKFTIPASSGKLSSVVIKNGNKKVSNSYKKTKQYIGKKLTVKGTVHLNGYSLNFNQKFKVNKFTTKIAIKGSSIRIVSYKNVFKPNGKVKVGNRTIAVKNGTLKISLLSLPSGKTTIKYLGSKKLGTSKKSIKKI
jgi:hypothetical protein